MSHEFVKAMRTEMTTIEKEQHAAIDRISLLAQRKELLTLLMDAYGVRTWRTAERETWLRANYPVTMLRKEEIVEVLNAMPGGPVTAHTLANWVFDMRLHRLLEFRAGISRNKKPRGSNGHPTEGVMHAAVDLA
jgi:hypothetical protein